MSDKRFATFKKVGDQYQKESGYLEGRGTIPADAIEITKEEEKALNNGFAFKDMKSRELVTWKAPEKTLEEVKTIKIAELKNARDTEEVEDIEYNDHKYDYDDKARERINAAITAMSVLPATQTIDWTTADNEDVPLTRNDLIGIVAAVATRSNTVHVKYRTLKAQVEACASTEEVEKIVW